MIRPSRTAPLVAVVLIAAACGATGGAQPTPGSTQATADAGAELPALTVTATIGGMIFPSVIVDTGDAVWVLNHSNAQWSRIDPATNAVSGTVGVGGPYATGGVLVDGLLWSLDFTDQAVSAVDPVARKVVKTIDVGVDGGWLVGDDDLGAVYVVGNDASQATRIDGKTKKATTLSFDTACGSSPATGGGFLWMVSWEGHLCKLDPVSGKVLAQLDGLGAAGSLHWAANRLLVPTQDGGVHIVNPDTMTLEATAPAPASGTYQGTKFTLGTPGDAVGVLSDGDSAWVRFTGATVGKLDLGDDPSFTVYAGLPLGHDAPGMAKADGSLWFSDVDGANVVRTEIPK